MIKPFSFEHLPSIVAIEQQIHVSPWSQALFADSLINKHWCHAMYADPKELLAYSVATVAVGECHLLNIGVAKQHQRQGIARKLMQHLLDQCRREAVSDIFLEVRPSNQAAIQLYSTFGFQQVGVRKNYYPGIDRREDAWVFKLPLQDGVG